MKHSKKWCVLVWFLVVAVFVLPLSGGAQFLSPEELKKINVCLRMSGFVFPGGVENGEITGEGTKIVQAAWCGSGFIVQSDGTIVTNYHVAQRALQGVAVFANGARYDIHHIKVYDPVNDLAVLKISGQNEFPTVRRGDSDRVQELDEVLAVGNPEAMGLNMTKGQVSQILRDDRGNPYLIRHTAQIAPGSSGGALYKGKSVIGVNGSVQLYSMWGTPTGFNNAIPINKVQRLLQADHSTPLLLTNVFNPDFDYLVNSNKMEEQLARNGQVGRQNNEGPGLYAIEGLVLDPLEDYVFYLDGQGGEDLAVLLFDRANHIIGAGVGGLLIFSSEYGQEVAVGVANYTSRALNFGLHIYKILW
ncbi:MAG: serine protease [Deltaproteobacteria bacterium]|nr:serine protease [Deltaproteobacteria bacterium]